MRLHSLNLNLYETNKGVKWPKRGISSRFLHKKLDKILFINIAIFILQTACTIVVTKLLNTEDWSTQVNGEIYKNVFENSAKIY